MSWRLFQEIPEARQYIESGVLVGSKTVTVYSLAHVQTYVNGDYERGTLKAPFDFSTLPNECTPISTPVAAAESPEDADSAQPSTPPSTEFIPTTLRRPVSGRESALQPMRRFAGQYKNQSIYGLGAQVSISAASRPYFVTAGYLRQLTHGRLADLPRAQTAGCLRTAGWRPFHPACTASAACTISASAAALTAAVSAFASLTCARAVAACVRSASYQVTARVAVRLPVV